MHHLNEQRNKIKFSIDPRRSEAEEKMHHSLFTRPEDYLHGPPWKILRSDATNLFTSGLSRNGSPDTCRPILSLQPLCPTAPQSGSICSPIVRVDRGGKLAATLAQGKDDKSWFRGIDMPCRASRKTLVGALDWDRWTASRGIISNGGYNTRRYWDPSAGVPSGSAWL